MSDSTYRRIVKGVKYTVSANWETRAPGVRVRGAATVERGGSTVYDLGWHAPAVGQAAALKLADLCLDEVISQASGKPATMGLPVVNVPWDDCRTYQAVYKGVLYSVSSDWVSGPIYGWAGFGVPYVIDGHSANNVKKDMSEKMSHVWEALAYVIADLTVWAERPLLDDITEIEICVALALPGTNDDRVDV